MNNSTALYRFDVEAKMWQTNAPEPALEGLSWLTLAGDGNGHVVVVGSDKKAGNIGWTRTMIFDATAGQWMALPLPADDVVKRHREMVEAIEGTIDLVGRIRLAWYRDPKGVGTDAEMEALAERCANLGKLPGMAAFASDLGKVAELIAAKTTRDALQAARAMQRKVEDSAFAQYPVPCSRRNAPLAYDAGNRLFVLFGGDHEDYQINDTWTLDLDRKAWKRMQPEIAPAPRAGHALVHLPKSGRIVCYEGYIPTDSGDYGAAPAQVLTPRELWTYDAKADRWDAIGAYGAKGSATAAPPAIGAFHGYSASWYQVPAMAADNEDRIVLAAPGSEKAGTQPATWTMRLDPAAADAALRTQLGRPANERRLRHVYFRADYTEVADDSQPTDLASLPANRWVELKPGPRVPMRGCRQRDWSSTTWDSDRDQVLMWGGGHCVRSSSVTVHYSPLSNRIVEGYDADEPYCFNGMCGPGSSLLNRQWIDAHAYHLYAYDPKCKLLVTARGFMYDPERMDWVRAEPAPLPFRYSWRDVYVASSPHGAVAWAPLKDAASLWLFDREQGWQPLDPQGKLFQPYCDASGMVYDSKRDRMLIGGKHGGYAKQSDGSLLAFDFKTKAIDTISPANTEIARIAMCREMVYVAHADWLLVSEHFRQGDAKTAKPFLRVYDCAQNKWFLMDAGPVGSGWGAGWMYDARRQLVYCFTSTGQAWALRLDPATAKLLEKPE
jgi:hypothetical protein